MPYRVMAAGGGYLTVTDMLKFVTALPSGKLISKRTTALAAKPYFHDDPSGYCCEWGVE